MPNTGCDISDKVGFFAAMRLGLLVDGGVSRKEVSGVPAAIVELIVGKPAISAFCLIMVACHR